MTRWHKTSSKNGMPCMWRCCMPKIRTAFLWNQSNGIFFAPHARTCQ
jgi:hypothetical protein